jgi:hypothetical protein
MHDATIAITRRGISHCVYNSAVDGGPNPVLLLLLEEELLDEEDMIVTTA